MTDDEATILILGHERACVRWAISPTIEDASRIFMEQVTPTRDALRSALLSADNATITDEMIRRAEIAAYGRYERGLIYAVDMRAVLEAALSQGRGDK